MRDQAHARAGSADRGDALLVAGPVEHDDDHVADRAAPALGDERDGLAERAVEVEQVGDVGRAGHLLHVHARPRVEHRAARRQRDHGQRARHPVRGERRALERVDGDVDLRRRAVADLLAVVEHRRLVLLALADHDDAVHLHRLEHVAHAVDGGLVGGLLVAQADQRRGREGGGLGDADELEREVAVGQLMWRSSGLTIVASGNLCTRTRVGRCFRPTIVRVPSRARGLETCADARPLRSSVSEQPDRQAVSQTRSERQVKDMLALAAQTRVGAAAARRRRDPVGLRRARRRSPTASAG